VSPSQEHSCRVCWWGLCWLGLFGNRNGYFPLVVFAPPLRSPPSERCMMCPSPLLLRLTIISPSPSIASASLGLWVFGLRNKEKKEQKSKQELRCFVLCARRLVGVVVVVFPARASSVSSFSLPRPACCCCLSSNTPSSPHIAFEISISLFSPHRHHPQPPLSPFLCLLAAVSPS
jgi:hypothetical protein